MCQDFKHIPALLATGLDDRAHDQKAGGCKPLGKKATLSGLIIRMMENDTAGCPVSGQLWTRRTTASVVSQLNRIGIRICDRTVARVLKSLGYALQVIAKSIASRQTATNSFV